jgi:hypothetical protein
VAAVSRAILKLLEDGCPRAEFPNAQFELQQALDFQKSPLAPASRRRREITDAARSDSRGVVRRRLFRRRDQEQLAGGIQLGVVRRRLHRDGSVSHHDIP